ncbi:MAG: carboxypeptidase-like regulatory domain-containing protein [Lutibacter sp.]
MTNDKKINTNGIKIIAAGKTVVTDKNGSFELNNLAIGKNYILVDQSTLDQGVITLEKAPYEVIILDNKMALLNIHLVKSANIYGKLEVDNNQSNDYSLQGYIKIQNDDFTYYTESNRNGEFKFQQIVPGNYKMTLLRLKENDKLFDVDNNTQVNIAEGESSDVNIRLKIKAKRIKFNNKNFKVGQ